METPNNDTSRCRRPVKVVVVVIIIVTENVEPTKTFFFVGGTTTALNCVSFKQLLDLVSVTSAPLPSTIITTRELSDQLTTAVGWMAGRQAGWMAGWLAKRLVSGRVAPTNSGLTGPSVCLSGDRSHGPTPPQNYSYSVNIAGGLPNKKTIYTLNLK